HALSCRAYLLPVEERTVRGTAILYPQAVAFQAQLCVFARWMSVRQHEIAIGIPSDHHPVLDLDLRAGKRRFQSICRPVHCLSGLRLNRFGATSTGRARAIPPPARRRSRAAMSAERASIDP